MFPTRLSASTRATRLPSVARAQQRLADAHEEFDAAVTAGRPMATLMARDHEVRLAAAALIAASGARNSAAPECVAGV